MLSRRELFEQGQQVYDLTNEDEINIIDLTGIENDNEEETNNDFLVSSLKSPTVRQTDDMPQKATFECLICMNKKIAKFEMVRFSNCLHTDVCLDCYKNMVQSQGSAVTNGYLNCPFCRTSINGLEVGSMDAKFELLQRGCVSI